MRGLTGLLITWVICAQGASAGAEELREQEAGILEELRAIRVAVEALREDVAALKEQRAATERSVPLPSRGPSFSSQGPDIATLRAIELPDKDDPEQVKEYISAIVRTSLGQNTYSDRDPQVRMLIDLGEENVPLMIDSLRFSSGMNNYHLRRAIVHLASERNKDVILEALPLYPELVSAVVRQGWGTDARDTLIMELRSIRSLPTEWIQAVASLRDPETYPLLVEYFVEGPNRSFTYRAIRDLPIESLDEAVEQAWNRTKRSHRHDRMSMAIIALEYGHVDALEVLVDALAHGGEDGTWPAREARPAVLRHTAFRGTNQEILAWFQAHRDSLVFDAESRRFEVQPSSEEDSADS